MYLWCITRLLAPIRRSLGGDPVPAVLGVMLLVALAVGAVFHSLAGPPAQWMNVNVALAMAPVALATGLFVVRRRRAAWWVGAGILLLLLPNTPYVLTDVVHAPNDLQWARALGGSGLAMAATFVALFAVGIVGYTYVLALLVADLRRHGRARFTRPALLATNAACAVGVWLGRVRRLNSWDAAHPRVLASALSRAASHDAVLAIVVVFVIVGAAAVLLLRLTDTAARRVHAAGRRRWGARPELT